MNKGRALRIFGGAEGGHDWGDTGTDVLAEDDRDCRGEGDLTGGGQRLKNTDGSCRALDDGGDDSAGQNTQNRVGEVFEQGDEGRDLTQRSDGVAHLEHTKEQNTEAQQNLSQVFFRGLFASHIKDDTDDRNQRSPRGWLEKVDQKAVALDVHHTQDVRGDGGTDVRTHDNTDGLLELDDVCVDQTDHDDGGGGGALYRCGDQSTEQDGLKDVVAHLFQRALQAAAGNLFQTVAQQGHTVQEECQSAQYRGDDAKIIYTAHR